jgi:hypothetical protein
MKGGFRIRFTKQKEGIEIVKASKPIGVTLILKEGERKWLKTT